MAALQVLLPQSLDKASKYVRKLMDKLSMAPSGEHQAEGRENAGPAVPQQFSDIPGDLLARVFSFLDVNDLIRAQLVSKTWRQHILHPTTWTERLSQQALAQLDALSALGAPVTAPQLYMATRGRNFLRNPAFRREANTQLLELGRSNLWGNRWTRNAWVENDALKNNVAWELRAEGLVSAGGAGEGAPPPPVPYAGGGIRLGERMQQGLAGLRAGLLSGLGAAAGLGVVGLGPSNTNSSGGAAAEADVAQALPPHAGPAGGQAQQGLALQEQDSEEAGAGSSSLASTSTAAGAGADGDEQSVAASAAAATEAMVAQRVTELREPPSCIATTSDWCEVMQVVDLQWELQRRGLSAAQAAHLLDAGLGLRLAVHVGSRANMLGQFCVGLMLDEGPAPGSSGENVADQMQHFVPRPNRHSYFSGRVRCNGTDRWHRFEYNVTCPRGFRRALVLLRGRRAHDPNAPALPPPVYCGAKFAAAELVFE